MELSEASGKDRFAELVRAELRSCITSPPWPALAYHGQPRSSVDRATRKLELTLSHSPVAGAYLLSSCRLSILGLFSAKSINFHSDRFI